MTLLSIFYHILNLFLSVEVRTVGLIGAVTLSARNIFRVPRELAHSSYTGQFRIFLDLNAPSLVFGQMPVEFVHLVIRHHVQYALDFIHREEMTAYIEHISTVLELRCVINVHHRQNKSRDIRIFHSSHDTRRQQFLQTLESIVKAAGCFCFNSDILLRDFQLISFRTQIIGSRIQVQVNYRRSIALIHDCDIGTSYLRITFYKLLDLYFNRVGQTVEIDAEFLRQGQCSLSHLNLFW